MGADGAMEPEGSGGRPLRVLLAKPGLDGHDRGVKVILRALRDAGMEVIYTGIRASPEAIARAALEEDVDAVGISNLSGAHRTLFPEVASALKAAGVDLARVVLFGGGIIPPEDHPALAACGYRGIFTPGTPLEEIVRFLRREARPPAWSG
jgi:methylmalonyl-CoA mutase C-terminal domain/subunit